MLLPLYFCLGLNVHLRQGKSTAVARFDYYKGGSRRTLILQYRFSYVLDQGGGDKGRQGQRLWTTAKGIFKSVSRYVVAVERFPDKYDR